MELEPFDVGTSLHKGSTDKEWRTGEAIKPSSTRRLASVESASLPPRPVLLRLFRHRHTVVWVTKNTDLYGFTNLKPQ